MREPWGIAAPTDAAEPIDLEQALDELFATPPEEFVAARNALAKALRGEKRRVEAGAVAAYRRPGRTAGALNRLVLSGDPAFEALLEAVDAVRLADSDAYRDAVAGLRVATVGAVDAVLAATDDERSEDRGDLTMALQAIVGDDNALTVLGRGRLEDVPSAGLGGFGGFGGNPSPSAAREPVARRKPRLPGARGAAAPMAPAEDDDEPDAEIDDTLARRRAEKALRAASAAAEKAERARAAAESEHATADEALEAAEAAIAAAEAALEQAQARLEQASDAASAAGERLEAATAAHAEAAVAAEQAQANVDALE